MSGKRGKRGKRGKEEKEENEENPILWFINIITVNKSGGGVVMYYTPGHKCPGCVVHHHTQFYGKIFWNKAIAQANLMKVIVQAIAQSK